MYLLKNKEIHIVLRPKTNNRSFNHKSSDDEVSSSKNRAKQPLGIDCWYEANSVQT